MGRIKTSAQCSNADQIFKPLRFKVSYKSLALGFPHVYITPDHAAQLGWQALHNLLSVLHCGRKNHHAHAILGMTHHIGYDIRGQPTPAFKCSLNARAGKKPGTRHLKGAGVITFGSRVQVGRRQESFVNQRPCGQSVNQTLIVCVLRLRRVSVLVMGVYITLLHRVRRGGQAYDSQPRIVLAYGRYDPSDSGCGLVAFIADNYAELVAEILYIVDDRLRRTVNHWVRHAAPKARAVIAGGITSGLVLLEILLG